ncbi:transmembrane protein 176B-like [Mugil cephalus]|uniref:transmembrane protein 176B-like n=1 Tax=Mugil cephalus TaxID=48193 RepID=UPI001FB742CF|nr:transmembrane protein 176B-like [Mugil cephalus]XP_047455733.1 transmembrane protein 176B-like [Mugil cephalus]
MSVTVSKADGVTVFTLSSDPQSPWPPLCQILKSLCYSPMCCSVSSQLRSIQGRSQSVLGALQILVGLLNVGLGAILFNSPSSWQMWYTKYPFWLGALYILFGIMCIVSEKYPSPCLVVMNTIVNLAGIAFAITGIVLYSVSAADVYLSRDCSRDYDYYSWRHHPTTPSPSSEEELIIKRCEEGREISLMLMRGIYGVVIVLTALELCVVISATVLGIKSLKRRGKEQNQSADDLEQSKPLLEEA